MSNMSYCRFRNTLTDLRDCQENMQESLTPEEEKARKQLIRVCVGIALDFGDEVDTPVIEA